ncbi:hypothetical protein QE152_g26750 [Popillia japonica]|uniref:Uncharacterized protein n=1 Tax=Popillia japonica TaxID=7064 RepID=A0AAW1JYE4_POPJA
MDIEDFEDNIPLALIDSDVATESTEFTINDCIEEVRQSSQSTSDFEPDDEELETTPTSKKKWDMCNSSQSTSDFEPDDEELETTPTSKKKWDMCNRFNYLPCFYKKRNRATNKTNTGKMLNTEESDVSDNEIAYINSINTPATIPNRRNKRIR